MQKADKQPGETRHPPPVKVLSSQLRNAETRGDKVDGCVLKVSRGQHLRVSLVWLQGTVVEVQSDQNTLLLMDETGTFVIEGVRNVPKGKPCLSQGKYVMVMGTVQSVSPVPLIHAVKMADLSDLAALHRHMWKLEVEELQRILTS
ncbi:recQ-mediated genome instability protein 2 [Synchiropus splendidus]|uniref:recQ-mediated genome instability protein 2 n=1 Tax=Synchiropus splendidus TaxID=270530 RepID=UPI00237D648D|nr:recQ-mediated genome instability protein 2 [Synchiropus splendidus]